MKVSFYRQLNSMDCGAACLRMICSRYGINVDLKHLRDMTGFNKQGVSLLGISDAAEKIGFKVEGVQTGISDLANATLPCILHWHQDHFVVLTAVKKGKSGTTFKIADPAVGHISYNEAGFLNHWAASKLDGQPMGIALFISPAATTERKAHIKRNETKKSIFKYIKNRKIVLGKLLAILLVMTFLQLVFPLLTKNIVDNGISKKDLDFVVIILLAQLMLVLGRTVADYFRSRLVLNASHTILLSSLLDFWSKLTRIPLSYFGKHQIGDTLERLGDHKQIQNFYTSSLLNVIVAIVTFLCYSILLISYSLTIFGVYCLGTMVFLGWSQLFVQIRRNLNYRHFDVAAKEHTATLEFINGMHEIRLNNAEDLKMKDWSSIQKASFELSHRSLNYTQIQRIGGMFISQVKDIIVIYIISKMVISGFLTLGTMLAIQYIIGYLSAPVDQIISFVQDLQNARISMERLDDISSLEDEEIGKNELVKVLDRDKSIYVTNLEFSHSGMQDMPILRNLNVTIHEKKVNAIVGLSGAGKTTMMKILLKYYDNYSGQINIGKTELRGISPAFWRSKLGTVLQDGYIFEDTIARNIALGIENVNKEKLRESCRTANILSFIESLPNSFETKIGTAGVGLSAGQKQRILIARAVYKDPEYLFLDESTNALDAKNEKDVISNLEKFFKNRTVVIIAHRLSTIIKADNIVVLDNGHVVEEGTHDFLLHQRGAYYDLIKSQLSVSSNNMQKDDFDISH